MLGVRWGLVGCFFFGCFFFNNFLSCFSHRRDKYSPVRGPRRVREMPDARPSMRASSTLKFLVLAVVIFGVSNVAMMVGKRVFAAGSGCSSGGRNVSDASFDGCAPCDDLLNSSSTSAATFNREVEALPNRPPEVGIGVAACLLACLQQWKDKMEASRRELHELKAKLDHNPADRPWFQLTPPPPPLPPPPLPLQTGGSVESQPLRAVREEAQGRWVFPPLPALVRHDNPIYAEIRANRREYAFDEALPAVPLTAPPQRREGKGASSPATTPSVRYSAGHHRVVVLSTWAPTKCGIATYSKHMRDAIVEQARRTGAQLDVHVIEMLHPEDSNTTRFGGFTSPVVFQIRQDVLADYGRAARFVGKEGYTHVVIQHEFGLFGGHLGNYLSMFITLLHPTIWRQMLTHTVEPDADHLKTCGTRRRSPHTLHTF